MVIIFLKQKLYFIASLIGFIIISNVSYSEAVERVINNKIKISNQFNSNSFFNSRPRLFIKLSAVAIQKKELPTKIQNKDKDKVKAGDVYKKPKYDSGQYSSGDDIDPNDSTRPPLNVNRIYPPANMRLMTDSEQDSEKFSFITVPKVIGKNISIAKKLLQKFKLVGTVINRVESDEALGTVIIQRPVAGSKAASGSYVSLEIAMKRSLVRVPKLYGTSLKKAENRLSIVLLEIGKVTKRQHSEAFSGLILRQTPRAGSFVKKGSSVNVVLAVTKPQIMPNLVGQTLKSAHDSVNNIRLKVINIEKQFASTNEVGRVLEQRPESGKQVRVGDEVSLVVGIDQLITIPNVLGLSIQKAKNVLLALGLKVGAENKLGTNNVGAVVSRQNPLAGHKVESGHTVNLSLVASTIKIDMNTSNVARNNMKADTDYKILIGLFVFVTIALVFKLKSSSKLTSSNVVAVLQVKAVFDQGEQSVNVSGNLLNAEDNDE